MISVSLCSEAVHHHGEGDAPSQRRLRDAQSDRQGSLWGGEEFSEPLLLFWHVLQCREITSKSLQPLPYYCVFAISKLCFHDPFCVSNENPKLSVKYSCPPQASYQQPQTQTPSSQLSFPPLPLPIPQGSRPGVGLLFLGRHKSRHFIQIVCFTGECATRSCTKTLGLFTTRTVHFSFLFLYQSVFHHCFSPTFSSCSTQLN